MSRNAEVELDWADDTYTFRLGWKQIEELQEKCDAGPYVILQRLYAGEWRVQEVSNVIRLGLIGGGLKPSEALHKVRVYVEDRPPMESLPIAQAVLAAGCIGAPDEDRSKKKPPRRQTKKSTTSPTEKSGSP